MTYIYAMIFVSLFALLVSQCRFLNIPPAIALIWFPSQERDTSTTIATMFSPIGNAIGQVLPALIVIQSGSGDDDDDYKSVEG
jgi:hypothetical protein